MEPRSRPSSLAAQTLPCMLCWVSVPTVCAPWSVAQCACSLPLHPDLDPLTLLGMHFKLRLCKRWVLNWSRYVHYGAPHSCPHLPTPSPSSLWRLLTGLSLAPNIVARAAESSDQGKWPLGRKTIKLGIRKE